MNTLSAYWELEEGSTSLGGIELRKILVDKGAPKSIEQFEKHSNEWNCDKPTNEFLVTAQDGWDWLNTVEGEIYKTLFFKMGKLRFKLNEENYC